VAGRRPPSPEARGISVQRQKTDPVKIREWALAIVSAGFRALALRHHPDHGGKAPDMVAIYDAAAWLREKIQA
jgi:hypothetical protein